MVTSRPSTPAGLSPRGSYVNLADVAEPGDPLFATRGERGRLNSLIDDEAQVALLKSEEKVKADQAKKEESPLPAGSPGVYWCRQCSSASTGNRLTEISLAHPELLRRLYHDDGCQ